MRWSRNNSAPLAGAAQRPWCARRQAHKACRMPGTADERQASCLFWQARLSGLVDFQYIGFSVTS